MIRNSIIFTIILLTMAGCSQRGGVTNPGSSGSNLSDYIPLKAGNTWAYSGYNIPASGTGDTSVSSPLDISIFKTNTLVGGQPNAFIVQTDNEQGHVSYLAFNMTDNTLWTYLGPGSTFNFEDRSILWVPGGVGAAVVGVNQTQKYIVTEQSGNSMSFSILRPPDPSIALASMTSQDTVKVSGVSAGETMFTLKRDGGTASDTMAVLIGVSSNLSMSFTLPFPVWIPVWQLTNSSSGEPIFSLDTAYSFRRMSDSAECRDELQYLMTNRFIGSAAVPALNMTLNCDRFEMTITVNETITLTDKIRAHVLFSGLSTSYTIDMWLAKGIGFVKGIVNGNSRSLFLSMGGSRDSSGVLNGYYISPRVVYVSMRSANAHEQYFHVDDTPLGTSAGETEFILKKKNF
jgi:hypothetical protein